MRTSLGARVLGREMDSFLTWPETPRKPWLEAVAMVGGWVWIGLDLDDAGKFETVCVVA